MRTDTSEFFTILSFDEVHGASSYAFSLFSGEGVLLNELVLEEPSYTFVGLQSGTEYTAVVNAIKLFGSSSFVSGNVAIQFETG